MTVILDDAAILDECQMVCLRFRAGLVTPRSRRQPHGVGALGCGLANVCRHGLGSAKDDHQIDGAADVVEARERRQSADWRSIRPYGNHVVAGSVKVFDDLAAM